jgi:hypothetical protein
MKHLLAIPPQAFNLGIEATQMLVVAAILPSLIPLPTLDEL